MELPWSQRGHFPSQPDGRRLSAVTVPNAMVQAAYARLSPVYDVVFGAPLQPGRVAAIRQMAINPGDRVLEVGVGTGLNASLYPPHCRVTAIDVSAAMLDRAQARIDREGLSHVQVLQQDAARMTFADESFDCVYAPYVISTAPDPVQIAREMARVCRPAGRIVILGHFRSAAPLMGWMERVLSPLTVHVGFRSDLDLTELLRQADLRPLSIERVNVPPIWSLVTCTKGARTSLR